MIDKTSPLPLYYQIEEAIKQKIDKGEWESGSMISSEREFAENYEVSRMTVRQAINNLVNDGYLTRRKGKGTFVSGKKIEQKLLGLTSFTEDMKARGYKPASKLVSFQKIEANHKLAKTLEISQHDVVYEIKRVRLADEIPMAIETTFVPAELIPLNGTHIKEGSLYSQVENAGFHIDYATQSLEASIAREAESEILEIAKGAPVLLIQRQTFLTTGKPLELVHSVYRGDRYKFMIDMKR
ncbi:GntR family transcriptional regulator [Fictibacillus phosphorivorans]|uniref:GntR family transcriptional regulator n=1 Tax=Fictibacillus phosphorivorans TaxID=1221500 RepID=UPI00203BEF4D|nr:GntR family transcriptional regulator [Fictibacillus phosphorivorans]MCM3718698.1 GntR family transcriptional regulator [Fictibacillus phosphorivorans]MCM3776321.1 GntR family transcriptional regulator [Fictibacillus phosphorivorans]